MPRLEDEAYWKSMLNMALTKFLVLRTLYHCPMHGYAIVDELKGFTKGCCIPTYGGVYPILKELVRGEYAVIRTETINGRRRKVYHLTEKGERAYLQALRTWREAMPYMERAIEDLPEGEQQEPECDEGSRRNAGC